jgi:hypothetical protein
MFAGLNEAMGYICLAAMAPVYTVIESWMIKCSWEDGERVFSS